MLCVADLPDVVAVDRQRERTAGQRRGHPADVRAVVGEMRVHVAGALGACPPRHDPREPEFAPRSVGLGGPCEA